MSEKEKRGFASMDAQKQRDIASKGGRAAHEKGTAHEFDSSEAKAAGRKGGRVAHERGTAHEFTSQEARTAGRKGGQSRGKRTQMQQPSAEPLEMSAAPKLEPSDACCSNGPPQSL